ncbi:MAG TPA: histidinol-phosphatase [Candidatus Avidesulfovibrio excrementigallinarum]|nr:histidinol-phosphatase [Candidatus Avidesulfovibrio excrementigallinarum]
MITVDLHSHTHYSHGKDSVSDMAAAAAAAGMRILGFSEHSPRPNGYDYPQEYREQLKAGFPAYLSEVRALRERWENAPDNAKPLRVLLGLEMDWFSAERPFIERVAASEPWDYLIGSVHFLGHWGFDASAGDWDVSDEVCYERYDAYFRALADMAGSRIMNVAAHPDIIKIFSVDRFNAWLDDAGNMEKVRRALMAMKASGMAMEISAAGLRKPCAEIYPGPRIMRLAADLELPITFASDAHNVKQLGWNFDRLAEYARSYGYATSRYFVCRKAYDQAF